jgi:STE24 endopeptidase
MTQNLLARTLLGLTLFVTIAPVAQTSSGALSSVQATTPQSAMLQYSLPPDKLAKAYALYRIDGSLYFVTGIWAVLVLWVMLRGRFGGRLSALAQRASRRRVLQAAIVMSLFVVVLQLTQLPFEIYGHHISLNYGLSVQRWGSWFNDWLKSLLLTCLFAALLGWILYAVIRRSPRRWWFYFWLAFIPIVVLAMFVEPVWIEPLFNKYEPLAEHHADLVAQIERVVHRAGMEIPPQRMYEMKASEKTTTLNAYVTGFGATKRVVVWDTTMKDMTIPETLFVFGHEMGHYVLGHIPKEVSIILLILLALFYAGYRVANWLVARHGERWGIPSLSDWASLPMLALVLFVLTFLATPIFSGVSRHFEHQADQYGLEVVHGLVPDEPRTAALAFQKLGEISLDYPYVSKFWELWAWDHPTIRDRMIYVQTYNPWAEGKQPEFVNETP